MSSWKPTQIYNKYSLILAHQECAIIRSSIINNVIVKATIFIIILGWAKETYLLIFGSSTFAGDLRHFSLSGSQFSLAKWFLPLLLLFSSFVSGYIAFLSSLEQDLYWKKWRFLSILFVCLSIDKSCNLHQLVIWPFWAAGYNGALIALWSPLIPAGMIAAYLSPLFRILPKRWAISFALAACCFVGGSIILDAISSMMAFKYGPASNIYTIGALIEETFEATGIALLAIVLIDYSSERWTDRIIHIR